MGESFGQVIKCWGNFLLLKNFVTPSKFLSHNFEHNRMQSNPNRINSILQMKKRCVILRIPSRCTKSSCKATVFFRCSLKNTTICTRKPSRCTSNAFGANQNHHPLLIQPLAIKDRRVHLIRKSIKTIALKLIP